MSSIPIRYATTSDGVDIAYAAVGSGPPLLVARAVMRQAVDDELGPDSDALWLPLARQFTVVMWDPRGFGLSAGATPEYTMESSVKDTEAVVNTLSADRFSMLAHLSMALSALAYAARHPDQLSGLVLWNPSPPGSSPRSGAFLGLPDISNSHFQEFMQLAALRQFGWERARTARRYVEHMTQHFTPESWHRVMSELEELDPTALLPDVTTRTLIISDTTTSIGNVSDVALRFHRQLAASLPNAELVSLKPGSSQTYIEVAARFLGGEAHAAGSAANTAVILFADIVSSTSLSEELGDSVFRERSGLLEASVRKRIAEHHGRAVSGRTLGDGVLATFDSSTDAIAAALECARVGADIGLALHLGLHAGDVIREQDAVFGQAVSIASRVSDLSAPNEVLVSGTVRDLARASAGVTFEDRGEHELKGLSEPVRVFAVRSE